MNNSPSWDVARQLPADHPSLAGHFPGQPVFPGVVLLAEVLEAALSVPALSGALGPAPRIDSVKFLAPIVPTGQPIPVQVRLSGKGQGFDFELRHDALVAVRGHLAC